MKGKRLTIRDDVPAATLRRLARREPARAAAARMFAIANALEGMTRAEAARLAGMERQALRQLVLDGPEVEATGVSAWTLAELCREVEVRWGVRYHEGHMSKLVRALGLSRQKARPSHPKANPAAREAFAKGGFKANSTASPPSTLASA